MWHYCGPIIESTPILLAVYHQTAGQESQSLQIQLVTVESQQIGELRSTRLIKELKYFASRLDLSLRFFPMINDELPLNYNIVWVSFGELQEAWLWHWPHRSCSCVWAATTCSCADDVWTPWRCSRWRPRPGRRGPAGRYAKPRAPPPHLRARFHVPLLYGVFHSVLALG